MWHGVPAQPLQISLEFHISLKSLIPICVVCVLPLLLCDAQVNDFPSQHSVASLTYAANRYHDAVSTKEWSKEQGKLYLNVEGLNKKYCQEAEVRALRLRDLLTSTGRVEGEVGDPEGSDEEEGGTRALEIEFLARPENFEAFVPPAWSIPNADFSVYIDTIMHQCFLGVRRTTWFMVEDWAKGWKKFAALCRAQQGVLEQVQRLQLDWAVALPAGKRKSYVAENWIAASRLGRWVASCVGHLKKVDEPYVQPVKSHLQWNGKECEAWLRAYGMVHTGLAAEKQLRVLQAVADDPDGTQRALVGAIGCSAEALMHMLNTEHCMIARIMCTEVNEHTKAGVDLHVKMFLDAVERVDSKDRADKRVPKWVSTGNLISLLNLGSRLEHVGVLRRLYEGDGKGEKFLMKLKGIFRRMKGLKGPWPQHAMERWYQLRGMDMILAPLGSGFNRGDLEEGGEGVTADCEGEGGGVEEGADEMKRMRAHHVYNTTAEVLDAIESGKAISTVCFLNETGERVSVTSLGVALAPREFPVEAGGDDLAEGEALRKEVGFAPLEICYTEEPCYHGGAHYYKFKGLGTPIRATNLILRWACLSLPLLHLGDDGFLTSSNSGLFYTITNSWEELGRGGAFTIPSVH